MLGQLAANITSEEISTVAGNTEEISSVLGHLAVHITSEVISTVAENTGNFLNGWGRLVHILQVRKFPQLLRTLRKFPWCLGI